MRILVIGENGLDRHIKCSCTRICPEAPVPVVKPKLITSNKGMAGNVVENLFTLGPDDIYVTFLTHDSEIIKTRYVEEASGYIMLRVDENDDVEHEALTFKKYSDATRGNKFDAIIISDYNKGYLSEDVIEEIIRDSYFSKTPIFIDTKKILGPWSRGSIIKINEKEYNQQLQKNKCPELFCSELIVTLGANGATYYDGMKWNHVSANKKIAVADVSGAGDTYLAQLVIEYVLTSKDVLASMAKANLAAGVAVSKHGVVSVKREEVV